MIGQSPAIPRLNVSSSSRIPAVQRGVFEYRTTRRRDAAFASKLVSRENGSMKTTFDLPDDLVKELKLRAVRNGRKLKDAAADILRAGLAAQAGLGTEHPAVVVKDKKTGLPVIQCRRAVARGQGLTPDRIAEILTAQEAGWARLAATKGKS